MLVYYLDLEMMKLACHPLAEKLYGTKKEPVGQLNNEGLLDSALHAPQAQFGGKDLINTIEEKAAVLHYSLVKNHAYENGNKRISVVALFTFLWINGYELSVSNDELANRTLKLAKSQPGNRENILKENADWIKSNIVALTGSGDTTRRKAMNLFRRDTGSDE